MPVGAGRIPPDEALAKLRAGNARFAAGTPHGVDLVQRRAEVAGAQAPFAAILACADSRVAPELVFDQSLGDLFVVRVAGNFVDDGGLGSLEFAVASWRIGIIVVLGHEQCGAVTAVRGALTTGERFAPHLDAFQRAIGPAIRETVASGGDVQACVLANARYQAAQIRARSEAIAREVDAARVAIVAATYALASGDVVFLDG